MRDTIIVKKSEITCYRDYICALHTIIASIYHFGLIASVYYVRLTHITFRFPFKLSTCVRD